MAKTFDFSNPPFDRLRPAEVERVESSVDVVFQRQGSRVLARGDLPDHLFVVVKGEVEERADGEDVVALHEAGDAFDTGILVHQACRHDFVVREEAICYRLPIEEFLELTANNQDFAAFFYRDISHKLDSLAQRGGAGQDSLGALTARVDAALLSPPVLVPPGMTLHEAALRMDAEGQRALLLEHEGRLGIVTGVDLTRAAVRDRRPLETPVSEVASFGPVGIDEDSFLFEAALLMARRRMRHLVVRRAGGEVVGMIDAARVLSSLANQADPIGALIDRATGVPELAEAGDRITHLVRQLQGTGTKVGFITELSSELHRRMMERLFRLRAPEGMAERACLVVMGSEGRGEYLLKTDQDNGLILEDGYDPPDLRAFCQDLVDKLVAAGFPPCPGDIMASNPKWSKPLRAYRDDLAGWVAAPGEQAVMDVAIFYDAAPVAGREDLVGRAKDFLFDTLDGNQAFHARFARAVDMFDGDGGGDGGSPKFLSGLFGRGDVRLDLKKAGIFPLMHGIRALALERRLPETNTVRRIRRLAEAGLFDKAHGQQLADAFAYLLGLRLAARLEQMRLHRTPDNTVDPGQLTKLERDLLRESLQIVKRFKELVRHHFHLGLF